MEFYRNLWSPVAAGGEGSGNLWKSIERYGNLMNSEEIQRDCDILAEETACFLQQPLPG